MKIVVTGADGFIGTNLVAMLRDHGHTVLATDIAPRHPGTVVLDIRRPWPGYMIDVDAVIHLAAMTGVAGGVDQATDYVEHNTLGTFLLMREAWAANVKRFVNVSTAGAIHGPAQVRRGEWERPAPISFYGASKAAGEAFAGPFCRDGMHVVTLRLGNVYGPGAERKASLITQALRCAASSSTLTVYGDGDAVRDFVYVGDVCDAIAAALRHQDVTGVFNIASGSSYSVNAVLGLIRRITGRPIHVERREPRAGELAHVSLDVGEAALRLGWRARTSFEDGLYATWRSFER